jgi:hypothetical protein
MSYRIPEYDRSVVDGTDAARYCDAIDEFVRPGPPLGSCTDISPASRTYRSIERLAARKLIRRLGVADGAKST